MSLISLSLFVWNKKIDHTILNPTLMHKATTHKKQGCQNREGSGGDCVPPTIFLQISSWGIMSTTLLLPPPPDYQPFLRPCKRYWSFWPESALLEIVTQPSHQSYTQKKLLSVFFHVIHQFSFSLVHKPKSIR